MNRSTEVIKELYKPYEVKKVNNVYIFRTMEGDFVLKENPLISYYKLYSYLESRGFIYFPSLIPDSHDDIVLLRYEEDISYKDEQKAFDLIGLVGLLHSKTSYFKEVTKDKYKEVYENINNQINYLTSYYHSLYDSFIESVLIPSKYLFLRNFSIIYASLIEASKRLDTWYSKASDLGKERVCLCHGNLRLDHYIKNKNDYIISWDKYSFDTPVLDLDVFYKNEWENIDFQEVLKRYYEEFSLNEEERLLLSTLIILPFKVSFLGSEMDICRRVRELINYLDKSFKIEV